MKKFLLFWIILFVGNIVVCAQTYKYKCDFYVDKETGVKNKAGYTAYFTFTNNSCYRSDKNGNYEASPGHLWHASPEIYYYKKIENGIYVYKQKDSDYGSAGSVEGHYLWVSSDKSRLNLEHGKTVSVFEKISEPEKKKAPTHLY